MTGGAEPARRPAGALALFDPSGTSHSGNALRGLAAAAREAGYDTTVFGHPRVRPDVVPTGVTWIDRAGPIEPWPDSGRREHRRVVRDTMREYGAAPGRVFCDLGLDRTVASRGRAVPASPETIFVLHRVAVFDHVPKRWRRRIRGRRYRNRWELRRLGRAGGRFVAHTDAVAERMADFVPADQITRLGWPVLSERAPSLRRDWQPKVEERLVLLAGSIRAEKGFDTFLQGVADTGAAFDRLVVPGRLPAPYRELAAIEDPRIELWDRWLDESEYLDLFARAAVVVLPYDARYTNRGTMSSVLLEAMASGRPLLVSPAIAHLLPPGYEGAVVADTTAAGIAAGLERCFADLDQLERAAMTAGRRHIAEHHTYEQYVAGLARTGGLPVGTPRPVEAT
ncbi:MAG: glycosyltransferase family 4 protein [Acidimicrobiia bacterium]